MRWCALLVIAAVIAACSSDPTLEVTVTHPTGLAVAKTTVTVYESESLRCTDIEFARLDAAGLEALAVDSTELDGSGASGPLSALSRTGNKVIVARGFADDGSLVSAGCVEKGAVVGADSVAITTMIAAVVSIRPPTDAASIDVAVTLSDASGAPIADARPITWTVYGPAGSTASNADSVDATADGVWEPKLPSCASGGFARLHPNPPSVLGGYAVQVRAAWAVEEPAPYTSLAATAFAQTALGITPSATARRFCAIRMKGPTHRLVCVDTTNTAYDFAITVSQGRAIATMMGSQSAIPLVPAGQNVVAVIAEPAATGTDRDTYAVSDHGVLVPLFGAPAPTDTSAACVACSDAIVVPPCGSLAGHVLIAAVANTVKQIDLHGGNLQSFDVPMATAVQLDSAGCVTTLQTSGAPLLAQFASVHGGTTVAGTFLVGASYLVNCSSGSCKPITDTPLTRGAGVGFTGGTEPRMILTTVDATGVVLVQLVLSPGGSTIERARMPAASIPDHLVVGQVDTDTGTDVFWNIASRNTGSNFQVAYARKVGNVNLEALSPLQNIDVTALDTGDLNGDALDDIVVMSSAGAAVVPMGVALPVPPPNPDATCTP